jgi:glycosyltransferase involved in cell wall biosynthesis
MTYSLIIPVYNSEDSIENLCRRIRVVFGRLKKKYELILVDDYSADNSWRKLESLHRKDPRIKIIKLAKNFGEHNAVMAGLNHAAGKFLIVLDDDGQNPPEEIPKLIDKMREGYDVVYTYYKEKKHNLFRNLGSAFNNLVATVMLRKSKGLYLSSFKIFTQELNRRIIKYTGPYPYIDGLIIRVTKKIGTVEVEHREREKGKSSYTLGKLISLWSNVYINFSILPLRFATYLGIFISVTGFFVGVYFLIDKIIHPDILVGWASTIISIYFLGGIQLFMLGMIGEYLGRLYLTRTETPQYVIEKIEGDFAKPSG